MAGLTLLMPAQDFVMDKTDLQGCWVGENQFAVGNMWMDTIALPKDTTKLSRVDVDEFGLYDIRVFTISIPLYDASGSAIGVFGAQFKEDIFAILIDPLINKEGSDQELSYWIYAGKEDSNFSLEAWDNWIYTNEGFDEYISMDEDKFSQLSATLWTTDDTGV
jgi:hypothetical protein